MKTNFLFIALLLLMVSCEKSEDLSGYVTLDDSRDYIIFGNLAGFCSDDCRSFFMLTADKLRKDADQNLSADPTSETIFQETSLEDGKFQIASQLLNIPEIVVNNEFNESDLLNIVSDTDMYILGKIGSATFELKFDIIDENASPALIEYANLVKEVYLEIR